MDKKSIISVFILTILLFGMNQWFGSKQEKQNIENIKKKQQEITQKKEATKQDIQQRTASIKDLPITTIYTDAAGKDFLCYALDYNTTIITELSSKPLPDEVYIKRSNSFVQGHLLVSNNKVANGVVYATDATSKLPSTYLPAVGSVDLQMVHFSDELTQITLAEYEDHHISIPDGSNVMSSIALYKIEGRYIPVGFYDAANNEFSSFSDIGAFDDKVSYLLFESRPDQNEAYYVLENDYLQIVFSNIGGSITEINLPFSSTSNMQSIVKPIEIDRTLTKQYPYNAYFPSHDYWKVAATGASLLQKPALGGYYPLLRRSIKNNTGQTIQKIPYQHYAFYINSDDEKEEGYYKLTEFTTSSIAFEKKTSSRLIVKRYYFETTRNVPYCFNADIKIDGNARGLWVSTGIPEVELISGSFTPALKYLYAKNGKNTAEEISPPKNTSSYTATQPLWISNGNGFFGFILDPIDTNAVTGFKALKVMGEAAPTRLSVLNPKSPPYPANKYPGYAMLMPLATTTPTTQFRIYAGPFQQNVLEEVDILYDNPQTGYNPDYIDAQSYHGWFSFISIPFAKFLFMLMKFFYGITHSWGFSIIFLTIALRVMLYPLNAWSIRSTLRMQQLSPKITALQAKYKKDPKKAQTEMVKLYKEHGVNPFSGCFPVVIQMPFLIGMFDLLKSTFELRGAGFIPGWIDNLTAPDVVFSWKLSIPFIGDQFHLLPILLGLVMFLQQRLSQAKNKTDVMTDQQRQQVAMGNIMTVVFTVIFYNMPSGLNIYFLSSTLLSMLQQWWMNKKMITNKSEK
ncbi:MAG: membrane protein insertase YidC [Chlamydiales bacterium]|nr:membrane protein insertase YidC [Chlamydiales bacterium]